MIGDENRFLFIFYMIMNIIQIYCIVFRVYNNIDVFKLIQVFFWIFGFEL